LGARFNEILNSGGGHVPDLLHDVIQKLYKEPRSHVNGEVGRRNTSI
jgi:hypothetical protein